MDTVTIGKTTKGDRIWIQGLDNRGWPVGARYNVHYTADTIVVVRSDTGKRAVSKGKGGIIDLVGKRVTQWAQGASQATTKQVCDIIEIERVA